MQSFTLEGKVVRLEPAGPQHYADLAQVYDPIYFQHYVSLFPKGPTEEDMRAFVEGLWNLGKTIPIAIVLNETGKAVGSTSYLNIEEDHRGLEIGYSWIGRPWQGTKVNPESKFLLLRHAFESLGCIRVQLKCDARNAQSQAAIKKLGAKFEGILRNQAITFEGHYRNTAMFSILDTEWPDVKDGLERRLEGESG